MTEDQLEQQCLEWFAEGGWEIAHGPDLAPEGEAPERADYRQVLLLMRPICTLVNPYYQKKPRKALSSATWGGR